MNRLTDSTLVRKGAFSSNKCLKSLHSAVPRGRPRGQTTVEFALICLPFFAILFALIDYAQIYFYENCLQNGMREAARFATAGRYIQVMTTNGTVQYETNAGGVVVPVGISSQYSPGQEASRNECIRYWFLSNCIINVPLSNIVIISAATLEGDPPVTTTNSVGKLQLLGGLTITTNSVTSVVSTNVVAAVKGPGAANDYVQLSVTYSINTITPLFGYLGGYARQGWNKYPVTVSAIVKNEPALLNFQHTNLYPSEP